RGEASAATAAQGRRLHLSDHVVWRHASGKNLAQGFVATALDVVFQAPVGAIKAVQDLGVDMTTMEDHAGGGSAGGIGVQTLGETLQRMRRVHADSPCFLSSSIISSIFACSMRTHM